MPSVRGSLFGQRLGEAFAGGAASISQAIQAKYLHAAEMAQKKADRAYEEAQTVMKGLVQQGLEPQIAQQVIQPEWQQRYATGIPAPDPGERQYVQEQEIPPVRGFTSPIVNAFEEWRTREKRGREAEISFKEAQTEVLKGGQPVAFRDMAGNIIQTDVRLPKGTRVFPQSAQWEQARPITVGQRQVGFTQKSPQGQVKTVFFPGESKRAGDIVQLEGVTAVFDTLFNTARGFNPGSGPMQRLYGTLQKAKASSGAAPDIKAYMDVRDSTMGDISRTYGGERGVLTDQDLERIKKALPDITDTREEIEGKYDLIIQIISQRIQALESATPILSKAGTKTKQTQQSDPLGITKQTQQSDPLGITKQTQQSDPLGIRR